MGVNNSKNQATTVGTSTLTYDNNGSMITDPVDNSGTLAYDAWGNRQVNGGCTSSYGYDALGRRIKDNETDSYNGGTAIFKNHDLYYSTDWQVLEDRQTYTVPGTCTQNTDIDQYVWGQGYVDDLVLRDRTPSGGSVTRTYVQQDANHNVTALVNTSGTVLERFVYDPYGKVTALNATTWATVSSWNPGNDSNAWRYYFQGGRYETGTNLYAFRNRDYSPLIGTWVEADPSGYVDGLDLYLYEGGAPTIGSDPLGLQTRPTTKPSPKKTPTTQPGMIFPQLDSADVWGPQALQLVDMSISWQVPKNVTGEIIQHMKWHMLINNIPDGKGQGKGDAPLFPCK